MKDFRDYYQVLGVSRFATAAEIRTAYRRAARLYHPDVSRAPDASARMAEVNEAHDVLSDRARRGAYDVFGARHGAAFLYPQAPSRNQAGNFDGSHRRGSDPGGSDRDPSDAGASDAGNNRAGSPSAGAARGSDFFSSLFGRRADRPAKPEVHGVAPDEPPSRGADQEAHVQISVAEAYQGTTRTVTLGAPPEAAGMAGGARTSMRTIEVSIPKGVRDGQRIRVRGQGGPSPGGGRAGDFYLEVNFSEDPNIRTEGRNVSQKLPVAPWEAALGATIEAETVAGQVELRIPPGSHSGRRLRLRGKGLPGAEPGDLFLEIELVLPPAKSEAARELYERMSREMRFDPRAGMKTRRAAEAAAG